MVEESKSEGLHKRAAAHGKKMAKERYQKHYHESNPHHKKHMVADAVLSVIVVLLLFFTFYLVVFYQQAILREQISLEIMISANTVESGQRLDFVVNVKNNTGQALSDTRLLLPEGLNYTISQTSLPLEDGKIFLGTLDAGEAVSVAVEGYALLDIAASLRINAVLEYQGPLGVGQKKLASEAVSVTGSLLDIELDVAETIIANQPFPFTLKYHNRSEVTQFDNVTVIPNWPPGWEIVESDLAIDELTGAWSLGPIGSLETDSFEGVARLETSNLEEAKISLRYFAAPFGTPLWQGAVEQKLPVRYPNVKTSVSTNVRNVSPGGSVLFTVGLENEENFPLREVEVVFNLNQAVFQTSGLLAGVDSDGDYVVSMVSVLGPGRRAEVKQTFNVRSLINPALAFADGPVQVVMPVEVRYDDPSGQRVTIPLSAHVLGIHSDLSVEAFARYFSVEGDQIGRGPLPPRVGETTKYWIFIQLNNQLHRVKEVVVNATLQPGVNSTGRSSVTAGQALQFQGNSLLTWSVTDMPDYKNDFGQERFGAAFEVSVTPTAEQNGQVLNLLKNIEVQARDAVTGKILTDRVALVTSQLAFDSFATDDGKVEF